MLELSLNLLIILSLIMPTAPHPKSNNKKSLVYNNVIGINTICDIKYFNITITMEKPFKGVVFAKEFSQKCSTFGNFSESLILSIPTSGCGISLSRDEQLQKMYYMVTIILQQDKYLKQISDERKNLKCNIEEDNFQVKSRNIEFALRNLVHNANHRKGRMKEKKLNTYNSRVTDTTLFDELKAARAWMEITPTKLNHDLEALKVGEPALLVVKSTLPVGIGWRVINCIAHDGLGESSQKLVDENGCPVDELLLPALYKKPAKSIVLMKYQEAVSKFAAFKFPDRDRLHLSCSLQLCRNSCPQVYCSNWNQTTGDRIGRTLIVDLAGDILDRLEVFNSIEVKAPEIELHEDYINFETNYGKYVFPFGKIPGDRTFCVSPSNMVLSFCLVGLVFLCAVFMAVWSLLRTRRTGENISYYAKSLFSSNAESPYLSHRPKSIHSYGRIF